MLLRRVIRLLTGIGLAASIAIAAPAPAEASPKITVTATGTIVEGADRDGSLTGDVNPDLGGRSASVVHVFAFTPGAFVDDTTVPGSLFAFFEAVTTTVTVGANTVTFSSTDGSGFYNLIPLAGLDASSDILVGTTQLLAGIFVFDDTLAFDSIFQEFSFTTDPGGWSFGASAFDDAFNEKWSFFAAPSSVTVTVERIAVPAPAALGLFLVGLAGLAAALRRS